MKKQVLFIHGGGDDGYGADALLAASLQEELGPDYQVIYPKMPWADTEPDPGWVKQVGVEITKLNDNAIWAGHSLGASMLLKWLSENKTSKKTAGIFLVAPPFWSGKETWKQGFILHKDLAQHLPKDNPLFFYHCQDDEVVTLDQMATYKQELPWATFHEIESGGHQLDNDLSLVAKDIRGL